MFLYIYKLYYPSGEAVAGFRPQYGYGAAVSIVAALIVGAITFAYLRLAKKLDDIY
jgi:ABC-type sugar transport system permease subunit